MAKNPTPQVIFSDIMLKDGQFTVLVATKTKDLKDGRSFYTVEEHAYERCGRPRLLHSTPVESFIRPGQGMRDAQGPELLIEFLAYKYHMQGKGYGRMEMDTSEAKFVQVSTGGVHHEAYNIDLRTQALNTASRRATPGARVAART